MDPNLQALALKGLGAFAGAALALVFLPPKTWGELARRAGFSFVAGVLFGENIRDYLHWFDTVRMNLAADALTAMVSWTVYATVIRVIGMWKPKD